MDMTPIVISKTSPGTVWYERSDGHWQSLQFNQSTDTWVEGSVSDTRPADAVDDPALADSITLDISDPAHRTEALQAAANVLAGINKLRAYFASVDQNLSFPFDGKMMRAGDILDLEIRPNSSSLISRSITEASDPLFGWSTEQPWTH